MALAPLLNHATAKPRPAGTSFVSQPSRAAGGSRARPTGTSQRYDPDSLPSRPGPHHLPEVSIRRLGAPARGQVPPRSVVAASRGRPPGARQAAHDQVSAPNRRGALFDHCGSWRCCRPARGGGVTVDQQGRAGADLGTPGPGGRGQRAGCRCLARPRGDGPGRLRLPVAGASGSQPAQAGPGVKLPWARVAGWPAAPPRRLGAPHRGRSGAVAPRAFVAARPEPGSGRVLRATCR